MIRKVFILCFLTIPLTIFAKPAYNGVIDRAQADGTIVKVLLRGDEHFHYITDIHGNWLTDNNGQLEKVEPLTDNQIATLRQNSRFNKAQTAQESQGVYLAPRGLVILANFSDAKFQAENTQEAFDSLMNVQGYTYHGVSNSVRDYFIDQSHGQYQPQFDVVGPVEVSHTIAYYGKNDSQGYDSNAEQLIVDACKAAKKDFNIDFTQYDNDGDNEVDFVFVFYAGYGEADGASENTIWQHMYKLKDYAGISCVIDGKSINLYACGSELAYQNRSIVSNPRDGICTCCHEFSHVCGLPDMYLMTDNYSTTVNTLGMWDVMDNGTYNNNGWTPPSYSAYEKFFCGWLTPTLLNSACDVILPEQNTTNAACIITATGEHNLNGVSPSPTTFYLLENRQQTSWDKYLPGHGLLITKIMYNKKAWENNTVNTESQQRVAIQPADGKTSIEGDNGDTYPGTKKITSFIKLENYPITDITETSGVIRFKFMGGGEEIMLDLNDNSNNDCKISVAANGLHISNLADGSTINIYDLSGKHILTDKANTTETLIPLTQHGIYILQINNTSKTILF